MPRKSGLFMLAAILLVSIATPVFAWEIMLDGTLLSASTNAWETGDGQVMVALDGLKPSMIDAYALNFDGWQITIIARGYGITAMVTSPEMKRDGFAYTFSEPPIVKDNTVWFPIESLAKLLNCTTTKDTTRKILTISSPESAATADQAAAIVKNRLTSIKNNAVYLRPPIASFTDFLIPGPQGMIPARLYDPTPGIQADRALYINIHGGGWTVGSIASSDHVCRDIANRSGQLVMSIEYGMLPEHPFPDGWEDAYAATLWAYRNAGQLGVDPNRIVVGGDSAGATIANAVSMMARDRGVFTVAGQVLAYPVVDMTAAWAAFVFSNPADKESPYAVATKGNLKGMPRSLVLIAETDGLRPQGEAYAEALKAAGVVVDSSVVPGTNHGFLAVHAGSRERVAQFLKSTGR